MTKTVPGLMPDLAAWQQWADRRRRGVEAVRRAKGRFRPVAEPRAWLWLPRNAATTLVVIDKGTPSCRVAIVEPLRHLDLARTAVLAPRDLDIDPLEGLGGAWEARPYDGPADLPATIGSVLTLGAYLHWSEGAVRWAQARDVTVHLVQHGLLTPWSPPAPAGAHVLAWCDSDAEYWTRGRPDVTAQVVGSQMLWAASHEGRPRITTDRPVMLGQLHGTELTRRETLTTYLHACAQGEMLYRPHPNEKDAVSRTLHAVMRRRGVEFASTSTALTELTQPVVSIFSTGTLEAAMRGLPAWVTATDPPPWVRDFWRRYGLAEWGGEPTPPWPTLDEEPAATLARVIRGA